MSNVVQLTFDKKEKYVMGCPECEGAAWMVIMDTEHGREVVDNPDTDIDFDCTGIECADCGFHIDMQGTPTH